MHRIRGILLRKRCGDLFVNFREKILKCEPVYSLIPIISTVTQYPGHSAEEFEINSDALERISADSLPSIFVWKVSKDSWFGLRPYQVASIFEENRDMVKIVIFVQAVTKSIGKLI